MPEEAVDVVFDGEVNGRKWWILHIEPTGAVNLWKLSDDANQYQRMDYMVLELVYRTVGSTVNAYLDSIIASLDIEGLYRATPSYPVGGAASLSEIKYKVVQVSG